MTIMMMIGADIAQTGAESRHSRDNYRAGGWCCLQPAPDVPLTEGHTIIGVMRSHHLFISPHLNIPPLICRGTAPSIASGGEAASSGIIGDSNTDCLSKDDSDSDAHIAHIVMFIA